MLGFFVSRRLDVLFLVAFHDTLLLLTARLREHLENNNIYVYLSACEFDCDFQLTSSSEVPLSRVQTRLRMNHDGGKQEE